MEFNYINGTLVNTADFIDIDCSGYAGLSIEIGTDIGTPLAGQIDWFCSVDGINFNTIYACDLFLMDGQLYQQTSVTGQFTFNVAGMTTFRVIYTGTTTSIPVSLKTSICSGIIQQIQATTFVSITGTVPLPTGAATEATLAAINAKLVSGTDIGDVTINNTAGAGAVNIQDGGNSITVDGTIAATQSGTWILGANSGVDIGDVTINNAAGAAAVNIQDGGNSITVDGTVSTSNFPTTVDTNYGAVGANTLRGASQIGNATGAALFGAGTTTAQVLRVVLPTDQTVIPVQGQKTNNNAAPGATNVGVLPALATAAVQTWTEGNQVALSTDLAGRTRVLNTPTVGVLQTYSATASNLVMAASATDIFTITGSATKTIMLTQFLISGTATSATVASVDVVIRSTANTGGTSSNLVEVPNDSTNAAATATTLSYTVNPTLGTTVGTIRSFKLFMPPPTGGNANTPSTPILFPHTFSQPITLRGTGQVMAFNLKGVTIAGSSFNIAVEWVEI